jgi:hypothetical protein
MSIKQIILTALLATAVLAMPAPAPQSIDENPKVLIENSSGLKSIRTTPDNGLAKRYAGGWCTFHIHEDMSNGLALPNAFTDKIALTLFDNDHNVIGEVPQTNLAGHVPYSVTSQLPWTIEINDGPNRGWAFAYADQGWNTEDTAHCSAGGWENPSIDNGQRWIRDYDCGFSC